MLMHVGSHRTRVEAHAVAAWLTIRYALVVNIADIGQLLGTDAPVSTPSGLDVLILPCCRK